MNNVADAAGALATGAAAGDALDLPEPRGEYQPACLNCGARVTGAYCSACGQSGHLHRSASHVIEEFLHGVWHFDSKAWRTLPMLALNPGKLTRDYVHGHRQRYVAPLALFLLSVFLMFFVFGVTGGGQAMRVHSNREILTLAQADRALADLDKDLAAARADPQRTDEIKSMLFVRETVANRRARIAAGEDVSKSSGVWDGISAADKLGMVKVKAADSRLKASARRALGNPDLFFDRLQNKGYKLAFLLVPLSLPWLWLSFARRRDVRLYDHVVFLLYGLSFMALLIIAAHLADIAGAGGAALLGVALIFPVHLFRQLKGAYALTNGGALWRTAFLAMAALFTLLLYVALIVAIGLLD